MGDTQRCGAERAAGEEAAPSSPPSGHLGQSEAQKAPGRECPSPGRCPRLCQVPVAQQRLEHPRWRRAALWGWWERFWGGLGFWGGTGCCGQQ